jgi:hypothetical protein
MGYPSSGPEAAMAFRILLSCMAYIFGGAAVIGLSVYIVLVCSEMFFSEPRSKTQRAGVPQPARHALMAEESPDLSAAGTLILAEPERLREEVVRVTAPAHGGQIPMTVPGNLESAPPWP